MGEKAHQATVRTTHFLGWGEHGRPQPDDPAETYHEASKNIPGIVPWLSPGSSALNSDPEAKATIGRPVTRHLVAPTVALPTPEYPEPALRKAMRRRRSRRVFGSEPISLQDLSTLLDVAYGRTHEAAPDGDEPPYRSVPSAGALYPLEIYPVVRDIDGLAPGVYHFDPLRRVLEVRREVDTTERLAEMMFRLPGLPDVSRTCSVVLFVVGVFWRTRFKYGLRGYRWVLIEAGHVGQNVLLTAETMQLSAVPYGGIWDRRVDEFLAVDGVNESVVYSLALGSTPSGNRR
jgi:SagB-type dehydrogenase family enzyme